MQIFHDIALFLRPLKALGLRVNYRPGNGLLEPGVIPFVRGTSASFRYFWLIGLCIIGGT
jgi:hypothetical protein